MKRLITIQELTTFIKRPYLQATKSIKSIAFAISGAILLLPVFAILPTSASPTVSEYPITSSGSEPQWIAAGSDGALWFSETGTGKVGKITTSGAVTEYSIPSAPIIGDIAAGSDGALWFTFVDSSNNGGIGKITTSGSITEYATPTTNSDPIGITAGPDGALWFTEDSASPTDKIGRITTSGSITEYSIPEYQPGPVDIAAGSDGALWFTESQSNQIGKITTSGSITQYAVPGSRAGYGITAGPDGALWFTEPSSDKIGKITTSGSITEYSLPTSPAVPITITAGPDGALWFTEVVGNNIGRIDTSGSITEYSLPTSNAEPFGITAGPDGALWFAEEQANNIGRITVPTPSAPTNLSALSPTNVAPSLTWTASSGATSYNIYRNGTDIGSSTTNSYTDTGAPQRTNTYYVTAVNSGGESGSSNSISVAYDTTLPIISNFTANNGSTFSRQNIPFSSGVATQTVNSDGSVTVSVNSASGYADSGFYLYDGPISGLPNFTVNGTGNDFGLNLWFDNASLGDFFQWNSGGVLTGLGGDTYGLSPGSNSGSLTVNGSTQFYMMSDGQNHTLSDLRAGNVSGISSSANVAIWIGVDVGSGGSTSATIDSISGL